ncbi:MAG: MraY family glycosyltransferase [Patescibacteria group bacterium]
MLHFAIAFLLSFFATIPTIKFAGKFGLTTDKKLRKHPAHTHSGVVPRAGGVPIFIAFLLTTLIFVPLQKILIPVIIAGGLLVFIGVLDDKYDLSPYVRLILNFAIAALAISGGLGIPYVSNPFGSPISLMQPQVAFEFFGKHTIWIVADFLAIFWLVSLMNITNWSKGIDGQLPGFVGIACLFLALITRKYSDYSIDAAQTRTLAMIASGAFFGFLPWNFYPQKIMPGYGGGSLAGFLLGILTILSFGKLGTLLLVMSIPILDGFYVIARRLHHGKNPFKGDANHLHHLLLRRGWDRRIIVLFYMAVSATCGSLSLILPNSFEKLIAIILIYCVLFAWIYQLSVEDKGKLSL